MVMAHPARNWRPALTLGLLGLAAAVLLAGVNELTRERIADERQQRALSAVSSMLREDRYDNDLLDDSTRMTIDGLPEPATVYRARRDGEPVAVVIDFVTDNGYSGDIRLLMAADADGTVLGARVVEHRETPGLGDGIERDRSDWIEQFAGRSLGNPPAERWAPDRREGDFDTLTGATITSAAVTGAIRLALQTFERQRAEVLAPAPADDE